MTASLTVALAGEAETDRLGHDLALALRPGDLVALWGDLGAGKTALARAILRKLARDPGLDVPSPTFTLVQTYATEPPVAHFDLYRLSSPDELDELGLDEALSGGAALVEWPARAGSRLPQTRLDVELAIAGNGRVATISGEGPLFARVARSLAIRDFLVANGRIDAAREPFPGDASARAYEVVQAEGEPPRVLMNAPKLPLGPVLRDGLSYIEIAHIAREVSPFVAVADALRSRGFVAPEVLATDLEAGLLLLEHLGTDGVLDAARKPIAERYVEAARLLAALHAAPWAPELPLPGGATHIVPPFDRAAMLVEVGLLLDWYVPHVTGHPAPDGLRDAFAATWNALIDRLAQAEQSIVLRDYHSPNLIWRGERAGLDRLGLLDFQDAMIGPAAYDVASLAWDARVDVERRLSAAVIEAYAGARGERFDRAGFEEALAIMSAQRNSKILGIFVRLDRRDGKPQYLRHLPRIRAYLRAAFAHPALAALAALYAEHGLLDEATP